MKHLIVYAHPNPRSFSHAILETLRETLKKRGDEVAVRDLYEMGFDAVLKGTELEQIGAGIIPPDIKNEQDHIRWADVIAFIYPVWWAGMPAIMKGYVDRVFTSGFAYGFTEDGPVGLLSDTRAIIINSAGSSEDVYRASGMLSAMNTIADTGILAFCGIKVIAHKIFSGVIIADDVTRRNYLAEVRGLADRLVPAGQRT